MSYSTKIVNGQEVPLTAEEIAALEAGETARTLESAIEAISAKYSAKRDALARDIARALLIDGATMEANLASLRSKWAAFADAENAEIEALFT